MEWLRQCFTSLSRVLTARPNRPMPRRLSLESLEDRTVPSSYPVGATAPFSLITPAQLRHAYGFDSITLAGVVGDGSGQTIAIIDAYDNPKFVNSTDPNFVNSDLHQFDAYFGLADPPSFRKVGQDGSTNYPPYQDPNASAEIALDVEWTHALAPKANILLVEASYNPANPTDNFYDDAIRGAVDWARRQPGVSVVSMGIASIREFSTETSYDAYFTTPAGHNGVTFIAPTGDQGATGAYPSVSGNVLAVGGTSLTLSGGGYGSEKAWSGGGGGLSTLETRPSYQNGVASVVGGQRGAPDVSFDADPNTAVALYDSYNGGASHPWYGGDGTSLAASGWAALIAIADQGRAATGLGSLDGATQTLPMIYSLSSHDFHDVTSGGNGGYSAGPGYDLATGRGTPVANLLAPDLASIPALPAVSAFGVVDISGQGLWRYSGAGWRQVSTLDAIEVGVDAQGDVFADFSPGSGVQRYQDATGWKVLTTADLSEMAVDSRGDVVGVISNAGAYSGIWRYEDATNWQFLSIAQPTQLSIAGNGYVVAQINGAGVWRYEDPKWQQLSRQSAAAVAIDARGYVVADFAGSGVSRYGPTGWVSLTTTDLSQLTVDSRGDVAGVISNAGAYSGVWRYEDGIGWQWLTGAMPTQLGIAGNGDVFAEIHGAGLWRFDDANLWLEMMGTDAAHSGFGG